MSQEVQTVFPTRLPKRKALKEIHSEVIKTRVNLKKNGRIVTSSDKVVKVEVKVKIKEEEDEIERRSRMLGCTCSVHPNDKTGKYKDTGKDKVDDGNNDYDSSEEDSIGKEAVNLLLFDLECMDKYGSFNIDTM